MKYKMSSIATKEKTDCSGCNVCAEACPKHCIEMIPDRKGFLYPKVNTVTCVDCGVCVKVCPFEEGNIKLNSPLTAYAAWNKDREQYLASSSGGAAHVFSSYIIRQGGVVYGCTSESIHVRHIRVDALSELSKLQGSKYVQSDVRGLFSQVKADLQAGKPVLFIGTPCQVAGLKNYIKRIPEHLYLVDLICHGVPSLQMLHEHINHIMKGRPAEQLSFRKGQLYRIEITSRCGTVYSSEPYGDTYLGRFWTEYHIGKAAITARLHARKE
jgi:coenzyme F420-reducing hydrogenase beta subunit